MYIESIGTDGDKERAAQLYKEQDGKVIATNTTTEADVEPFRKAGVKYLVTSTTVLEGRSFSTNMMEASLIVISGKDRESTKQELNALLAELQLEPQLQELRSSR